MLLWSLWKNLLTRPEELERILNGRDPPELFAHSDCPICCEPCPLIDPDAVYGPPPSAASQEHAPWVTIHHWTLLRRATRLASQIRQYVRCDGKHYVAVCSVWDPALGCVPHTNLSRSLACCSGPAYLGYPRSTSCRPRHCLG